jgi:hypothetical protein
LNEMRGSYQLKGMTGPFQARASAKPNSSSAFLNARDPSHAA